MKKLLIISLLLTIAASSCVAVKGYQKVNLNDPDMALTAHKCDRFQNAFQSYREGASGANGGKTGGGCGCN